jgi:hypothetical protein
MSVPLTCAMLSLKLQTHSTASMPLGLPSARIAKHNLGNDTQEGVQNLHFPAGITMMISSRKLLEGKVRFEHALAKNL